MVDDEVDDFWWEGERHQDYLMDAASQSHDVNILTASAARACLQPASPNPWYFSDSPTPRSTQWIHKQICCYLLTKARLQVSQGGEIF